MVIVELGAGSCWDLGSSLDLSYVDEAFERVSRGWTGYMNTCVPGPGKRLWVDVGGGW